MVGAILSLSARRVPDAEALAFYGTRLSYAELNARACRLAQALAGLGIGKGDRVGALLHNCPQFIEAFFAAAKLGAVFTPVNFRLATPEIGRILESCTPAVLIHGAEFDGSLAPLAAAPWFPRSLVRVAEPGEAPAGGGRLEYEAWIAAHPPVEPDVAVSTGDDQLIVYTSGTTGQPKGAVMPHDYTLSSSMTKIIDFGLRPDDTVVVFGPLFHVGPLLDLAIPMLMRGGRLVLGRSRGFDPGHLLSVLEKERVTVVSIYPAMWRRLLAETDPGRYDLGSLRLLLTGGEPMPVPLLRAIYARFPGVGFINTYGTTESGPITTFLAPEDQVRKAGSIGKPALTVQLRIVDDHDREVPPGAVGEIVIRSPFVCRGYWNRPEATAEALGNGWWHTGDLARADEEGFLWIAGRKKDMIISGAENIYPVEIEATISDLPGVAEVSVVGVPDAEWGEAVAAFVVRQPGAQVDEAAIRDHCRARLAGYKKPRHILFVDELPRIGTTKVSKEQLRQRFAGA